MALADDLVQAVARSIEQRHVRDLPELPPYPAHWWDPEARAAVLATLRGVADAYVSGLTVADLRELASAVERGGRP